MGLKEAWASMGKWERRSAMLGGVLLGAAALIYVSPCCGVGARGGRWGCACVAGACACRAGHCWHCRARSMLQATALMRPHV